MNDCFWCFIEGVCDCVGCATCKEYVSVNSEKGSELYEKYNADVEEALKPVTEKWKKMKREQKQGLSQVVVWQVYTKEGKATGQIYVDGDAASKCAKTIDGYVVEARLLTKAERMVDFNGFDKGVIGKKLPADTKDSEKLEGVEEREKRMADIGIKNVITSLEEIKRGFGTLDEFIDQLKGEKV